MILDTTFMSPLVSPVRPLPGSVSAFVYEGSSKPAELKPAELKPSGSRLQRYSNLHNIKSQRWHHLQSKFNMDTQNSIKNSQYQSCLDILCK